MTRARAVILSWLVMVSSVGCDALPGRPRAEDRHVRPSEVVDFDVLYGHQCAGCHGTSGTLGAARPLNDALFLAVAPVEDLRSVIAGGVAGTGMPGFAGGAGGRLTDRQIDIIVRGMRDRWGDPDRFSAISLPAYRGGPGGDPGRGARAYATFCARCHGDDGTGGSGAGSVVDGAYLALVSDQSLRTTIIAGRVDLGKPDYRENVPGRPMTPREIDDVVAWLGSHRKRFPGQPYATGQRGSLE